MADFDAAQPLVYVVVLPLLIVTAVRNDSLKLQLHSSRSVVFHSTTVLLAGILLQGTAAAAYYVRSFGGTPIVVLAIVIGFTTLVGFIVALSSHSARSRVRGFINENFYNYKYDYRLEWKKFINTLTGDENTTGPERVLRTLTNLLDSPGGILWVRREGWRQFVPLAHWSLTEKFGPLEADDALLNSFENKDVVFVELSADAPGRGFGALAAALSHRLAGHSRSLPGQARRRCPAAETQGSAAAGLGGSQPSQSDGPGTGRASGSRADGANPGRYTADGGVQQAGDVCGPRSQEYRRPVDAAGAQCRALWR